MKIIICRHVLCVPETILLWMYNAYSTHHVYDNVNGIAALLSWENVEHWLLT